MDDGSCRTLSPSSPTHPADTCPLVLRRLLGLGIRKPCELRRGSDVGLRLLSVIMCFIQEDVPRLQGVRVEEPPLSLDSRAAEQPGPRSCLLWDPCICNTENRPSSLYSVTQTKGLGFRGLGSKFISKGSKSSVSFHPDVARWESALVWGG